VLREDNRAIIRAASQASKAANYILGFLTGGPAQAAGAVVSFALPWNPSKVEQCASWARNRRR
jgi:antirestriction protein ArdC